jgi:hypothetical protein
MLKELLCTKTLRGAVDKHGTVGEIFTKDNKYKMDFHQVTPKTVIVYAVDNQEETHMWSSERIKEHFNV